MGLVMSGQSMLHTFHFPLLMMIIASPMVPNGLPILTTPYHPSRPPHLLVNLDTPPTE